MRSAPTHGRQPVRDHQRGAALHDLVERLLHQRLALRIERAGRLVEQQDRRVAQDRPGDGDPLPLAGRTASRRPRRAWCRSPAAARAMKSWAKAALAARLDLAPARIFRAVGDIGRDRIGEQRRSPAAPARSARRSSAEIGLVHRNAVDLDLASVGIVEPQQQREDRGLARARRTDQRHPLARRHVEAQPLERARLGPQRIGEGHIAKGDLAARRLGQRLRPAAAIRSATALAATRSDARRRPCTARSRPRFRSSRRPRWRRARRRARTARACRRS